MAALIGLVGIVFLVSGFLDVAKVTDIGLKFVSLTQIHTLPLLNSIPSGWAYMIVGLVIMLIAGAMYGALTIQPERLHRPPRLSNPPNLPIMRAAPVRPAAGHPAGMMAVTMGDMNKPSGAGWIVPTS